MQFEVIVAILSWFNIPAVFMNLYGMVASTPQNHFVKACERKISENLI
jgi:hypothetical protein